MLFTNAEDLLLIVLLIVLRSTESAVSEHYHRSGVVASLFAAYVINPVLAVYARLIVLWSHILILHCFTKISYKFFVYLSIKGNIITHFAF